MYINLSAIVLSLYISVFTPTFEHKVPRSQGQSVKFEKKQGKVKTYNIIKDIKIDNDRIDKTNVREGKLKKFLYV